MLLAMCGLAGCSKSSNSSDLDERKSYNLSYGSHERQKLDVYLPEGRTRHTPFILLIHGGSWVAGDKSDMNDLQDALMHRGIASASMSYRYAGYQVHYTEQMQDVAAALDYCFNNQDTWNIRRDRYLIGGMSAGAHMALLHAYRYDGGNRLAGVISMSGPTDLTNTDFLDYTAKVNLQDEIKIMVGADYIPGQPLDRRFAEASPRAHIKQVPTLMLHGDNDYLIPYAQAQVLASDLTAAGVPNKLVTFHGVGHSLGLSNPNNLELLLTEIERWCRAYGGR